MTDVAKQYARAVFSLALENGIEENTLGSLKNFSQSLDKESWKFFLHPKITKDDKKNLLDGLKLDILTINAIKVIIDNSRFDIIDDIVKSYEEILNEYNNLAIVSVITKNEISEVNLKKIKQELKSRINRDIEINQIVDKSLIGGMKIEFEGEVIDLSINSELKNIKNQLKGGN
ncbi:MAG: ATP synthase F1 subunit delta [Candidatus Izemoplasmatales bacterium]|jgi:F-type H+-transporting ATPase subunit delta|nr:ATP synthase F1 subunit delta [Candidatus Izemoplasmatales bacterium]MDD4070489.1 ATP synthase F1 subunit delta [Candidatus Izemoplasmatales bacterium]MDY0139941.1 ATP synthase F1 subunit delta [Candidatus Izemoplasmatales bacterium]